MMSLMECAQILKVPYAGEEIHFTSISIDTRTLKPGALFIAIRGNNYDGHNFVKIALQKQALAVISESPVADNIPHLIVRDTRKALGQLARYYRSQFSLSTIVLTGSCGKTTTKEYLRSILNQSSIVLASEKSFNNNIGVPLTLLALTLQHQVLVLEIGADQSNSIRQLVQLAQPTIAMITNVEPAHLKGFGSLEQIAKAKSEIFDGLKRGGVAILPDHFKKTWPQYLPSQKTIYFGKETSLAVYAKDVMLDHEGKASFILVAYSKEISIKLSLPGAHQVENALAAATAALACGTSVDHIKRGLEQVMPLTHRLNITLHPERGTIIDDTYNATPRSVYVALEVLSRYSGMRIFVLGDMQELGEASDHYHALVGVWARHFQIHQLFTWGDFSKKTSQAFGDNAYHMDNRDAIIEHLKARLDMQCVTLVKGSRAMQMEKVVHALF